MALAVRRAAGIDRHRAVIVNDQAGGFPAVRIGGGDLHVARHADAKLKHVAALAAARLLGPQLGVARARQDLVESRHVLAGVVGGAGRRGVGELVGRDQVDPADLRRVHADLGGEQVHRPLDRGRGLWPAGAAVGGDRRRVGHHDLVGGLHVTDVVRAGGHQAGEERQEAAHPGVGTRVLHDLEPVGEDTPFPGTADLDDMPLRSPVGHGRAGSRCASRPSAARGRCA